jgi:hypothetical protein
MRWIQTHTAKADFEPADSTRRVFLWIWRVRQAVDVGFQADALEAAPAAAKIWQPTAVRTFFVGREE